ncbi:hypothetical protein WJX72_008497 [[Myrmecia] bisecta]|uniref:Large ribosomal subunit protein uL29m n=1 Tax=[Myrmecia] bisecta TaxID=41462 RepID=A0AAW1QRX2_9CHLO
MALVACFARTLRIALCQQQSRCIATSPSCRGLDELFEKPLKAGEVRQAGRAWKAADLRTKSWDDLHKLWYVLLKEKNMLATEALRLKANGEKLPQPVRKQKVRKSMARLKLVLTERAMAEESQHQTHRLKQIINNL